MIENDARIAIVGLGTVGSGVAEILTQHADRMRRHAGKSMQLARVVVRDASKPLRYPVDSKLVTDDIESLIEDRDIDVVAQLIGGLEPAPPRGVQLFGCALRGSGLRGSAVRD